MRAVRIPMAPEKPAADSSNLPQSEMPESLLDEAQKAQYEEYRMIRAPQRRSKAVAKQIALQRHCCFICRRPFRASRDIHVDHDHATGKGRGLLCRNCNLGLGHFHDDPTVLSLALAYLWRFRRKNNEKVASGFIPGHRAFLMTYRRTGIPSDVAKAMPDFPVRHRVMVELSGYFRKDLSDWCALHPRTNL